MELQSTKKNKKLDNRGYLSFEEHQKYAKDNFVKSSTDWVVIWNENKPKGINSKPYRYFKDKWIKNGSWPGFVGLTTEEYEKNKKLNLRKPKKQWRTYIESQKYAVSKNFKNNDEWAAHSKAGEKPSDIPANPDKVYKEFYEMGGWAYFLRGDKNSNFNKEFLSFDEAHKIILAEKIKPSNLWNNWLKYCKSNKKPDNIPSNPNVIYADKWIDMHHWLTGEVKEKIIFRNFKEAREFVHSLKLKNQREWFEYAKSSEKPSDIPYDPGNVYKNEWKGFVDWLGYMGNGEHQWKKQTLIIFLEQFKEYINVCSIPVLLTIIESNGLYNFIKKQQLKKLQESKPGSEERKKITSEIIKEITDKTDIESEESDIDNELTEIEFDELLDEDDSDEKESDNTELRIKQLKELENDIITASLDDERIEFLKSDSINNLWYDVLSKKININKIRDLVLNKSLPSTIKELFLEEYDEVVNMQLPIGWSYQHEPLLMQKLISYKLKVNKRYGNWSGAGSGKTIGAILAGRYVGAKNTLIITFNSTIGTINSAGWIKEIMDSFPDSNVYTKIDKNIKLKEDSNNYLILNYETFQQRGAANYIISLLEKNKFDYIILDEVQSIKQREECEESKRREVILGLIGEVRKLNPDYYLLAMSATPVINNLTEAKSLIELITFRKLDDVSTRETISNCIELFRRLVMYGIRHKNIEDNILKDNKHTIIEINGDELFDEASIVDSNDVISKELLILDKKLQSIVPYINTSIGKTIIYIHYVSGMEERIYEFLSKMGFSVGIYTGTVSKNSRQDDLDKFKKGQYDILIGSKPIGTGVDGLQKVSDREIILSLPWTNAELEQLEKRVNRKGSNFKEVDIIIPMVAISNNKTTFNWDKDRYYKITYKATIANATVDGVVPEKLMPKREKLEKDAINNYSEWIKRLGKNDFLTVEREELNVGLYPDITDEEIRRKKIESELIEFNRIGKITKSQNMNKRFVGDKNSWFHYHSLRKESMKDWEEIPYIKIADKITEVSDVVVDFGCGMNELKLYIPKNKVISFDHVAIDNSVIACDMRDISMYVESNSVDVCVFSLSLWGPNYEDYIKEAYRVLNRKGIIYIAEPFMELEKEQDLIDKITKNGFKIFGSIDNKSKFTYISAIKI